MTNRAPRAESDSPDTSDDRAISYQLDFLTAILIVVAALGIFFTLSVGLFDDIAAEDQDDGLETARSADMLAGDYLVDEPQNTTLNRDCTVRFFTKSPAPSSPPDCNHENWGTDDYLTNALPPEFGSMNVSLKTTSGDIQTINGDQMAVGDAVSANARDIEQWNRYVLIDANGDGTATIHRLTVYYWG